MVLENKVLENKVFSWLLGQIKQNKCGISVTPTKIGSEKPTLNKRKSHGSGENLQRGIKFEFMEQGWIFLPVPEKLLGMTVLEWQICSVTT